MTGILMMAAGNSYGSAPVNTVAPAVTGTATVGQTLTTTNGTWTGAPAPTFTYQWFRSPSTSISGATSSTYVLVAADAGFGIFCQVRATNSVAPSGVTANSNTTATVAATVPGAPTIGTATATGSSTATVAYTAPASNGGATITLYTATSSPGGLTGTLSTSGSGTITVSGLTAETSYTFTVKATNSVGQSAASSASNSITTQASYWIAYTTLFANNAAANRGGADSSGVTATFATSKGLRAIRLTPAGALSSSVNGSTNNYYYNGNNYPVINGSGPSNATSVSYASNDGNTLYSAGYANDYNMTLLGTNGSGSQTFFTRQRRAGYTQVAQSLTLGTDGFLYQGAYLDTGGVPRQLISRYSTSGTLQWVQRLGDNTGGGGAIGDGTNVYIFSTFSSSGSQRAYLLSYDISGTTRNYTFTYQASSNPSANYTMFRTAILYGGYLYVTGSINEVSGLQGLGLVAVLWKINPANGAIVWQYYVKQGNQSNVANDIYVGPDGYLYFTTQNTVAFTQSVTKLDTNANVSWQRVLSLSGGGDALTYSMTAVVTGTTMYLATANTSQSYTIIAKFPTDGSKTGSYAAPSSATISYQSFSSWGSLGGDIVAVVNAVQFFAPPAVDEFTTGNTSGSAGATVSLLTTV